MLRVSLVCSHVVAFLLIICRGFHYCHGDCYSTTKLPGNWGGEEEVPEIKTCTFYERTLIDPTRNLTKEPSLTELQEKLFKLASSEQLTFTVTSGDTTETYTVRDAMASESPEKYLKEKTFQVVRRGSQIDLKSSPQTSLEAKSLITSLGECTLACQQEKSFICESLSFCRDDRGPARCIMSSLRNSSSDFMVKTSKQEATCDIYEKAYLSRFQEMEGTLIGASGDLKIHTETLEDCARQCSILESFSCQSIAFCGGECLMNKEHALLGNLDKNKTTINGTECTLYTGMLRDNA